jgi:hypothetical protein
VAVAGAADGGGQGVLEEVDQEEEVSRSVHQRSRQEDFQFQQF